MAIFEIRAEHVRSSEMESIRNYCRMNKIRVTKIRMDELFTNFVHVRIVGDTKRTANRVRKFIWDELNGGAYCEIKRVK